MLYYRNSESSPIYSGFQSGLSEEVGKNMSTLKCLKLTKAGAMDLVLLVWYLRSLTGSQEQADS